MITALIVFAISSTLFGPSYYLDYPDEFWLILVGFAFSGFTLAYCYIPVCPEMVEAA